MAPQRQALLLSSSNCHGYSMLEFAKQEICNILKKNSINELVFIPYAQKDYDSYTAKIKEVIEPWGFTVTGLHSYSNLTERINNAKAIFVGGVSETHKGETRDQRIYEYLEMADSNPVLGLREGSMLHIDGYKLTIKGIAGGVLFQKTDKKPVVIAPDSDVSFLIEQDKEL
ncbi:unnamed protein product [Spodoptera exigua]|nr:unnamed protein product [Spodoptera exigua]